MSSDYLIRFLDYMKNGGVNQMASLKNIQSNAYRGDFLRNCIDKTIDEIHDDIVTVFGP